MKKISLLLLSFVFLIVQSNAQNSFSKSSFTGGASSGTHAPLTGPGETQITYSTDQAITLGNSVSCNTGGYHADNSYFRIFDLGTNFSITSDFVVNHLEIGIEIADGSTGSQPIEVRFYTLNGAMSWANLTLLYSQSYSIPDQNLTTFDMVLSTPVVVPANSILAVEIFTPNGQVLNNRFWPGSNATPTTSPSYIAAAGCGISEPITLASIGFSNMNIVMNLYGNNAPGVPIPYPFIAAVFALIGVTVIVKKRFF